jgi:hypothetical protein
MVELAMQNLERVEERKFATYQVWLCNLTYTQQMVATEVIPMPLGIFRNVSRVYADRLFRNVTFEPGLMLAAGA